MKRRLFNVEDASIGRLGPFVRAVLREELQDAERLVGAGAVYVDGRRCLDPERTLKKGERVLVILEEGGRSALEERPHAPPLAVLFEDDSLVVVNKASSQNTQPGPGQVGGSLLDQISEHLSRTAGLVHRLDRETSGVMVFGKTREATSALAAQFRAGTVQKRYLAACGTSVPEAGEVDLPLSRDPSRPGRWRATRAANGIPATTRFRRLFLGESFALVELLPETGRTHQLRAHLAALGAPILGDRRYGGASQAGDLPALRCLLHAQMLRIKHPATGRLLMLEAQLPADLALFFERAQVELPTGPA